MVRNIRIIILHFSFYQYCLPLTMYYLRLQLKQNIVALVGDNSTLGVEGFVFNPGDWGLIVLYLWKDLSLIPGIGD
ncbi:hypothetical protein ACN6MT_05660 [Neobacillus niacini]|uniref:hypothetical protein n=1 Tax=Neobacillus niacini TaxID=86668 RepID=UPI003B01AA34